MTVWKKLSNKKGENTAQHKSSDIKVYVKDNNNNNNIGLQ